MATTYVPLDEMLSYVGEFGRFQWMMDAVFSVMIFPATFPVLLMYFAGLSPEWKCVENSPNCTLTGNQKSDNDFRCNIPRDQWEFTEPKTFSITTEFDLVCDDEWFVSMTTSIMFIGWIIGAIVLGWIADTFGRKIVFFPASGICILISFATAFSPNIGVFLFLRFLVGFFIPGTSPNSFVMISEVTGAKYRSFAGIIIFFFFTIALCVQALKAYFVREWKILFIVCSIPYIFVLLFYPLIPESIRWLQAHGKTEKLKQTFEKIARWNKKEIPSDTAVEQIYEQDDIKASPLDLFKTKTLAINTLVQGYTWMINGMVYYGISLAADDLGGSLYVNYVLVSLADLPAVFVAIYLCEKIGRKKTVIGTLGLGSIACIIVAFIPSEGNIKILRLILGILGKFFITVDFDSIYTWSVELYPTNLRAQGMGFVQVTSRIGAATSPFIAKGLNSVHKTLPFIVMGVAALGGFGLCFLLPETKGKDMSASASQQSDELDGFHETTRKNRVAPVN